MEGALDAAAVRGRPVAMAGTRRLEVCGALGGLFPDGGLQRGSVVEVGGAGAVSLSLALAAGVMAGGASRWVAAVGFPSLGLVAAAQLGVPLDRLALVPSPGERWPAVVAALLDGVDLLLLSPPARLKASDARRLAARARERGAVLVPVLHEGAGRWPESADLRLEGGAAVWSGLGRGHGILRARRVEAALSGRRMGGGRRRNSELWLPGPGGSPAEAVPAAAPVLPAVAPVLPAVAPVLTALG